MNSFQSLKVFYDFFSSSYPQSDPVKEMEIKSFEFFLMY